jgi:hypothetical protein
MLVSDDKTSVEGKPDDGDDPFPELEEMLGTAHHNASLAQAGTLG